MPELMTLAMRNIVFNSSLPLNIYNSDINDVDYYIYLFLVTCEYTQSEKLITLLHILSDIRGLFHVRVELDCNFSFRS